MPPNLPFRTIFALGFLLMPLAHARTLHVDFDGGSDAADGLTPATAFKHYPGDPAAEGQARAAALAAGDLVRFKGGVHYRGALVLAWSGEPGKPIVYDGNSDGSYGSGRAVLAGGEPISGWTRCASAAEAGGHPQWAQLWYAWAPGGANALNANLVYGDAQLFVAQYPNQPEPFWMDRVRHYLELDKRRMTQTSIADERLAAFGKDALAGAWAFVFCQRNRVFYSLISDFDAARNTIQFDKVRDPANGKYALGNSLHPEIFDRAGEYVFTERAEGGKHKLYLWPPDGGDPNRAGVSIRARKDGVTLNGQSHAVIQGFKIQQFEKSFVQGQGGSKGVTVRGNEIFAIQSTAQGSGMEFSQTEDLLVEDNYAHHLPRTGFFCAHTGVRTVVRNNRVHMSGRTPIIFYKQDHGRIVGNCVTDCTGMHSNGIAVYFKCSTVLVAENRISGSTLPISLQDSERLTLFNNVFHASGLGTSINLWSGGPLKDVRIFNNVATGSAGDGWARAISIFSNNADAGSDVVIRNNVADGVCLESKNVKRAIGNNLFLMEKYAPRDEGNAVEADSAKVFAGAESGDFAPGPAALGKGADVSAELPVKEFPDYDFGLERAKNGWPLGLLKPLKPEREVGAAGRPESPAAAQAAP
ncbi:MAG: right-handed parallel beta-helix repeat-containing protein [Planctomycetota bacterium]|nr:right-handed parallel beta-helix repeat-containing protein [Planctomycetota bacterium]